MLRLLVLLACATLATAPAAASTPTSGAVLQKMIGDLEAAKQAGDYPLALRRATELLALAPDHPVLRAAYARTLALAGETDRALAEAAWLADHGYGLDARGQRDLGPLLARPENGGLAARLAGNMAPVGGLGGEILVQPAGFQSEGVDYDAATGRHLISSNAGDVISVSSDGAATTFYDEARPGRMSLGIRVDRARARVLACSAPAEGPQGMGATELLVLPLTGGAPLARTPLGPDGPANLCNDIAVLPDGRALITDSASGRVLTYGADGVLKPFTQAVFAFPNGVAVAPTRRQVFVSDFLGVWALDDSGELLGRLEVQPGAFFGALDGLYVLGERLVGIQNLVAPARVVAADLGAGLQACLGVLASGQPRLDNMTTAAVVGEKLAVLGYRGEASATSTPALVWVDVPRRACT